VGGGLVGGGVRGARREEGRRGLLRLLRAVEAAGVGGGQGVQRTLLHPVSRRNGI